MLSLVCKNLLLLIPLTNRQRRISDQLSAAAGQQDAMQKIIDDQDEGIKLAALAESIIDDGGLNPMDRLLVIKAPGDSGKFIAIEGNRRVAALKILRNPAILSGLTLPASVRRRLEAAAVSFDAKSVEPIPCYEVKDREEGAPWIQLRHTGENGGKGIVDWSSVAGRRFRGRDPALQALDFVMEHGALAEEEKQAIEKRFPITTLDRLLQTPTVRQKIGIDIIDQRLVTNLPADEVMKPLRRMVRNLLNRDIKVTELKKVTQQVAYISGLGADLPDLSRKSPKKLRELKAFGHQDFKQKPQRERQKPNPATRKCLVPRDCRMNVSNPKISEIFGELKKLSLADFPHSTAVLFRVFLETSVDHYLAAANLSSQVQTPNGPKDKSLRVKVEEATKHMIAGGMPRKHLDGITKALNERENPLYIETLHNYVHNRFYSPKERELRVAWDNAQPFFGGIWP